VQRGHDDIVDLGASGYTGHARKPCERDELIGNRYIDRSLIG